MSNSIENIKGARFTIGGISETGVLGLIEKQELEIKEIDCAKEAAEGCPAQCIHIKE